MDVKFKCSRNKLNMQPLLVISFFLSEKAESLVPIQGSLTKGTELL